MVPLCANTFTRPANTQKHSRGILQIPALHSDRAAIPLRRAGGATQQGSVDLCPLTDGDHITVPAKGCNCLYLADVSVIDCAESVHVKNNR